MLAWMNAESLAETLRTGEVTYWSRSRGELWRKGATSGPRPAPRRAPRRLRPRRLLLDRRPDRPGLPHQPARPASSPRSATARRSSSPSRSPPRTPAAAGPPPASPPRRAAPRATRASSRFARRRPASSRISRWWCQTGTGSPSSACSSRCSGVAGEQVRAAHHVGDPLRGVVDHHREVVGRADVLPAEHDVADASRASSRRIEAMRRPAPPAPVSRSPSRATASTPPRCAIAAARSSRQARRHPARRSRPRQVPG